MRAQITLGISARDMPGQAVLAGFEMHHPEGRGEIENGRDDGSATITE